MKTILFGMGILLTGSFCFLTGNQPRSAKDLPLDKIRMPEGFEIEVFVDEIDNARSMCLTPGGTLFVGTREAGNVYAVVDNDNDMKGDTVYLIDQDLNSPNGVAFRDGALYVAEISKILRYDNIESQLTNPPDPVVVYDEYPKEGHHGWKYIAFGPDDKLYVPVGAPCNICESDEIFASITRINPDGSHREIVHRGIRNTVGFTWHPETGHLWFTDNGRDWMGDNQPDCELNHAPEDNMHFGYPYCHEGDLPDTEFGEGVDCSEFTPPAQKLGPHVAPLGLEFNILDQFPEKYKGALFIAQHGSWNRTNPIGYRVMMVTLDDEHHVSSYEPFAEGWLEDNGKAWGRPVDVEFLPDGSMLVSDDRADVIYRIRYDG